MGQVTDFSYCKPFVELPRSHGLDITARLLDVEIVPGKEVIQVIVALSLCYYVFYPGLLYLFVAEKLEQQVDLIDVEIQHHQLHQDIVGDVLHGVVLIAPQAVLLFQLFYEKWFDGYIHMLHSVCKSTKNICKSLPYYKKDEIKSGISGETRQISRPFALFVAHLSVCRYKYHPFCCNFLGGDDFRRNFASEIKSDSYDSYISYWLVNSFFISFNFWLVIVHRARRDAGPMRLYSDPAMTSNHGSRICSHDIEAFFIL